MDVTFLELHLHDAEFNAPFAAGRPREAADEADESDGPGVMEKVAPLAALLAFVGLAMLARHLRDDEAEQATLDELEA